MFFAELVDGLFKDLVFECWRKGGRLNSRLLPWISTSERKTVLQ